jgi:pimeloyl-ACP methyl ester carboxylesterase
LSFPLAHPDRVAGVVVLNSFPYFAPQIRLRMAISGLTVLPWGAMQLVRRLTAFRLHSRHTHRDDMAQFMRLTA